MSARFGNLIRCGLWLWAAALASLNAGEMGSIQQAAQAYRGGAQATEGDSRVARQVRQQQSEGTVGGGEFVEPWVLWQRRPGTAPLIMDVTTVANSTVTLNIAGNQYTVDGVGCGDVTPTNSFVVYLKPHTEYTLQVSGAQMWDISIYLRPYVPRQLLTQRGAKASYRPYKTYIDGAERLEDDDLYVEFGSCTSHSASWTVELRPDRGLRPAGAEGFEEKWSRDEDNVDQWAPGDAFRPEVGPGCNPNPAIGALRWAVNLGRLWNGRAAGLVRLNERAINAALFTAAPLTYLERSTNLAELQVLTNASGWLRQIRAPQALVDIQSTNSPNEQCSLRLYLRSQVGASTNGTGLFPILDDTPFVTWRIRNPQSPGTYTRAQIIEDRPGGRSFTNEIRYESAPQKWSLLSGSGADQRTETRTISMSGATRTETVEIRDLTNAVYQAREMYAQFAWGWELTNVVTLPGGGGLTNQFVYYTNPDNENSYRRLKQRWFPGDRWESWYYSGGEGCPEWPFGGAWAIPHSECRLKPWKDGPASPAAATLANSLLLGVDFQGGAVGHHSSRYYFESIQLTNGLSTVNFWEEADGDYSQLNSVSPQEWHRKGSFATYRWNSRHRRPGHFLHDELIYERADDESCALLEHERGSINWSTLGWTTDTNNGVDFRTVKTTGTEGYPAVYPEALYVPTDPYITNLSIMVDVGKSSQELTYYQNGNPVLQQLKLLRGTNGTTPVFLLAETRIRSFDSLGHLTNEVWRDALNTNIQRTVYQASWIGPGAKDCELKQWEQAESGERFNYAYDSLKRLTNIVRVGVAAGGGYPAQVDLSTNRVFDVAGRLRRETVTAGGLSQTRSLDYDLAGRLSAHSDFDTQLTQVTYAADTRSVTNTLPGGLTRIEAFYLDGRPKSVTGTAEVNRFFDYQALPDDPLYFHEQYPRNVTRTSLGSANSTRWEEKVTSAVGDLLIERVPAFPDGSGETVQETFYFLDHEGQPQGKNSLTSVIDGFPALLDEWYTPNGFGETYEIKTSPEVGERSSQRMRWNHSLWEYDGTNWWHVAIEAQDLGQGVVTNKTRQRLTGFTATNVLSETQVIDPDQNLTVITAFVDRAAAKVTVVTNTPQSTLDTTGVIINGLLQSGSTESVSTPTRFGYDPLRRLVSVTDPLGFTTGTAYSSVTGWVTATTNQAGRVTTYDYYGPTEANAGKLKVLTAPNGRMTRFSYTTQGWPWRTWGDVPYPEERVYSSFGELTELRTFQEGSGWTGTAWPSGTTGSANSTYWNFDPGTGLLVSKVDAAGKGYTNDYHFTHTLRSRKWARDATVNYVFNEFGDLLEKSLVAVTATTTNLSGTTNTYITAAGQPAAIIDATGQRALSYDAQGRLTNVTWSSGSPFYGLALGYHVHPVYGTDQVKLTGLANVPGGLIRHDYLFDPGTGRLGAVSNGTWTVDYGYLAQSDQVETAIHRNSGGAVLTGRRVWDYGYRLRSQENLVAGAGSPATGFTYEYDEADRRTRAVLADSSAWIYGYNDRNEVVSGKRAWSDLTPVAGQQFEYAFDSIGNRALTRQGGDASGLGLRSSGYARNALNQYTARTNASQVDVLGAAKATASVTVNGTAAYERGEYFWLALGVTNASGPAFPAVTVQATENVTNVTTDTGWVYAPPVLEGFGYDLDGNLTADSRWDYTWDAENRLVSMETRSAAVSAGVPRTRLEFGYDSEGRRTSKAVKGGWNGSVYQTTNTVWYVYDGWNLVAEVGTGRTALRSYVWGLDLTGGLQTEGNVGGLLMVVDHTGGTAAAHFVGYDGHGNVVALVKTDGTLSARYEYGPFGETLRSTGPLADLNPFQFSTKFTDAESGLVWYGCRFYSPTLGRWISKDPIEEEGGRNLYGFVGNHPLDAVDRLGRSILSLMPDPGDQAAEASMAQQGLSLIRQVQNAVDAFNTVQEFASDVMDMIGGEGDSDEILMDFLSVSASLLSKRLPGGSVSKSGGQPVLGIVGKAKGAVEGVPVWKQLAGKGQLAALRRNPNLKGVNLEVLLLKKPEELAAMLKSGAINRKTYRQIMKAFEGRDLGE